MRYIPEDNFKRFFVRAHKINLWFLYFILGLFLLGIALIIFGLELAFFAIVLSLLLQLPYGIFQLIIMIKSGYKLKQIIDHNYSLYYTYWISILIALAITINFPYLLLFVVLIPMILCLIFTSIMAREEYYELIEEEEE